MTMHRCEFCHEDISVSQYAAHVAEHRKLRPDGQQQEYATLPPEVVEETDISDAPKWYRHQSCGAVTGTPEEIIRTYHVNPWFYLADRSFCTGCSKHVPCRELTWIETGENMQVYNDRLRAAKPEYRPGLLKRLLIRLVSNFV